MKTTHRTTIVARCLHGAVDVYQAEFVVEDRLLMVEAIRDAIAFLTEQPIYQENLTQRLANNLRCVVTTTGTHGQFATVCECRPMEGN